MSLPLNCENTQNALLEHTRSELDSSLSSHLRECPPCQNFEKSFQFVNQNYQKLNDVYPSAALCNQILESLKPKLSLLEQIKHFLLHPAVLAFNVFVLTLLGTYFFQHSPSVQDQASYNLSNSQTISSSPQTAVQDLPSVAAIPANKTNFRFVGTNLNPTLKANLEKPLLLAQDLNQMENISMESIANFKHQIAVKHLMDGDEEKASAILGEVINQNLNYSHWELAVIQHLAIMKKLGKTEEVQKDLARLREFAMTSSGMIEEAERVSN